MRTIRRSALDEDEAALEALPEVVRGLEGAANDALQPGLDLLLPLGVLLGLDLKEGMRAEEEEEGRR